MANKRKLPPYHMIEAIENARARMRVAMKHMREAEGDCASLTQQAHLLKAMLELSEADKDLMGVRTK